MFKVGDIVRFNLENMVSGGFTGVLRVTKINNGSVNLSDATHNIDNVNPNVLIESSRVFAINDVVKIDNTCNTYVISCVNPSGNVDIYDEKSKMMSFNTHVDRLTHDIVESVKSEKIKLNDTVKIAGSAKLYKVIYLFEKGGLPRANLLHLYLDECGNPRSLIQSNYTLGSLTKQDEKTLPKLKTVETITIGDVVTIKGFDNMRFNVINGNQNYVTLIHISKIGHHVTLEDISVNSLQKVKEDNETV